MSWVLVIVLLFLPDLPVQARWASAEDKVKSVERVRKNDQGIKQKNWRPEQAWEFFRDPLSYLLFLMIRGVICIRVAWFTLCQKDHTGILDGLEVMSALGNSSCLFAGISLGSVEKRRRLFPHHGRHGRLKAEALCSYRHPVGSTGTYELET